MRRYRRPLIVVSLVFLLLAAGSWGMLQGMWRTGLPAFHAGLRVPTYTPEGLDQRGPLFVQVPQGGSPPGVETNPYATLRWYVPDPRVGWDDSPTGVFFAAIGSELEIDTAGKAPVRVDGVQGWLWRLGPEDLLLPPRDSQGLRHTPEENRGRYPYIIVEADRSRGVQSISGDAIMLQWNRDGIHYLLIAGDREMMNVDKLLRMANSMAPPEEIATPPARPR